MGIDHKSGEDAGSIARLARRDLDRLLGEVDEVESERDAFEETTVYAFSGKLEAEASR